MAESILRTLAELNGSEVVQAVSQRVGAEERSTSRIVAAALPTLVTALARNVSSESGACSLLAALERDHDGAILDDVLGALRGAPGQSGDASIRQVLGQRRAGVETRIARQVGLDPASVSRILTVLAPLVLAAVGRARRRHVWDARQLARALGTECASAEDVLPGCVGVFEELLDADPDAEMDDDVSEVGAELLRRLSSS